MSIHRDEQKLQETINTYDRIAEDYVARNKAWGLWINENSRVENFQKHLAAPARVLDIGCGPGHDTANLTHAGYDAYGLDLSMGMLVQAAHYTENPFVLSDMRRIPFEESSFDGLWMCASLLHIPRTTVPAVMTECYRVLKPRGVVYISVKQGNTQFTESEGWERTFTLFEPDEITGYLQDAGFIITTQRIDENPKLNWITIFATKA